MRKRMEARAHGMRAYKRWTLDSSFRVLQLGSDYLLEGAGIRRIPRPIIPCRTVTTYSDKDNSMLVQELFDAYVDNLVETIFSKIDLTQSLISGYVYTWGPWGVQFNHERACDRTRTFSLGILNGLRYR